MISVNTSHSLRSLLVAIGQGEISIEKQRRALGKLVKYEPYWAFQRIDRRRTGFVDSMDILTFLRDNGFNEQTEADTYYLVKFFDVDEDEKLNYTEFLTLVLPWDNAKLRNEIIMRPNYYVGLLDYLPKTIEFELCKLFVKEIAYHQRIEKLKQELACKGDFDIKSGFKAIDDWSYNYIDFANLKRFLKSAGHVATNKELAAVIRRLDLNADSRLSLEEFEEGIKPIEPYSKITNKTLTKIKGTRPKTAKLKTSSKYRFSKSTKKIKKKKNKKVEEREEEEKRDLLYTRSPSRYSEHHLEESKIPTQIQSSHPAPLEAPAEVPSPSRSHAYTSPSHHTQISPYHSSYENPYKTPTHKSPGKSSHYSTYNPRNPPESIPSYNHTLNHAEEKHLVSALNDFLSMEIDLEQVRIDLSLRPDFNLLDLFRMFDIDNKGYITFDEFRSGIYLFHIYPNTEDSRSFFTRYETTSKGILNYSDFWAIFCPKEEEYSSALKVRPSYYIHKPYYRISEYFHPETRSAIEGLIADNLRIESVAETIRQNLSTVPSFNVMEAFNTIDMRNEGFLNKDQFKLLLEAHGIYSKQWELLVDRFDKTKDGKVTYDEFADGLRKY